MRKPNVWTAGPGLLEALAHRLRQGFPLQGPDLPPLDSWTILVPSRRARRALDRKLFTLAGQDGLVLPQVKPIGDIEDEFESVVDQDEVEEGVLSKTGQILLLLSLVDQWAADHPHIPLAKEIKDSAPQAFGLARSLSNLFDQLETEEIDLELPQGFFTLELASHRESLTSLLGLVQERLPQILKKRRLVSKARRRNQQIREEAARIAAGLHKGPIVAAGSTGTNPATRELLKAIANDPQGAVILPGLDQGLDDESWNLVGPEHPQFNLKVLLADLEVGRNDVQRLDAPDRAREALLSEMMRPAATTEKWNATLRTSGLTSAAARGIRLVEAPDRHIEARTIAVMMREVLETPGKTAALVTPDRDLGKRVAAELSRWGAVIDDSAGAPLARSGRAQLLVMLMDVVQAGFASAPLAALLSHPLLTLGIAAEEARRLAQLFEIVCLRQDLPLADPARFGADFETCAARARADRHAHGIIKAMTDSDWLALQAFVAKLATSLARLAKPPPSASFVNLLRASLDDLAPPETDDSEEGERLIALLDGMILEGQWSAADDPARTMVSLRWALAQEALRPRFAGAPRLVLYGLAEARMMEADLVILGGLNEGVWPPVTDPGPWINRAMRGEIGLQSPERDIGITAHDFALGLARSEVTVTWAKRVGSEPKIPSRWILRLRALLTAMGETPEAQLETRHLAIAIAMDRAQRFRPVRRPAPAPAVSLRPRQLSVSDVRTLQRDPYALYARKILKLDILPGLRAEAEPRLRGTLFHEAIARWLQGGGRSEAMLLLEGERVFKPYMDVPEVRHFWWPRFQRMAHALSDEERGLRQDAARTLVEVDGAASLEAGGVAHRLTARADRIDILKDGSLRIIDFKSGTAPTANQVKAGLEPQLSLEVLIARKQGFGQGLPETTSQLLYVLISGLGDGAAVKEALSFSEIDAVSAEQEGKLKALLAWYLDGANPYQPRRAPFREADVSDYDHLSRHAEWSQVQA